MIAYENLNKQWYKDEWDKALKGSQIKKDQVNLHPGLTTQDVRNRQLKSKSGVKKGRKIM